MAANGDRSAVKSRKRTILIIVLSAVTLLSLVSWVLTEHSDWVGRLFAGKPKKPGQSVMYSDELRSYVFYPTDYNLDPMANEDYVNGTVRLMWYKDGPMEVGYPFDDASQWEGYNDAVLFFVKYFQTVLKGDAETYNTFFTEKYLRNKNNTVYDRFAPQMIHNIHINQLSESTDSGGVTTWTFNVDYEIFRNDGTFRNDLPPDGGSRTLLFTLIGDASGKVLIDSIDSYRAG